MNAQVNAINWFEIPAEDINRAKAFYETIFGIEMKVEETMPGMQMASFPYEPGSGKVAGAVVQGQMHQPSQAGAVLYLNANPDLSSVLEKVDAAGGQVVMPKMKISDEIGSMAFFVDTEGNKIGLHSQG